jgi:hypothetical protein
MISEPWDEDQDAGANESMDSGPEMKCDGVRRGRGVAERESRRVNGGDSIGGK